MRVNPPPTRIASSHFSVPPCLRGDKHFRFVYPVLLLRFDFHGPESYIDPMAKAVKTVILLFWLVMMGLLIHRTYLRPTSVIALDVITEEGIRSGDEWFGIYQQDRKIGYAHTRTMAEGDAYHISEESEMDVLALGRVQRIRTSINAYTTRNFQLKYFAFSLRAEASSMDIKGAVVRKELVLDILTGGQTRTQRIRLAEAVYLTPNLRPAAVLMGLEPGRRYRFPLFNPVTMSTQDAFLTVESKETIKVGDADQTVYKLKESFEGMEAYAWITQEGETIKEQSPLGYSLLKETQAEALKRDKRGPAVDIIAMVKVPSREIGNAAMTTFLRARLGGAELAGFELDGGRQSWKNGTIEIQATPRAGSYVLP